MLVGVQAGADGVGHGADTHLQAGPVRNELRAVQADLLVYGRRLRVSFGDERTVILHQRGETLQRDKVPIGKGNVGIHHGDALPGHFQSRYGAIYRGSQGNHPVHRLRHLHHGHIAG